MNSPAEKVAGTANPEVLLGDNLEWRERLRLGLGDEGYLALVENHGGTRLYVPRDRLRTSSLVDTLTIQHLTTLAGAFGGMYVRVPLDRDFMIEQYLKRGYSRQKIVRQLRVTESGYERMLKRLRKNGTIPQPSSNDL